MQCPTYAFHDSSVFVIHQEHSPSLPSFLWVTTRAAGTTMTRRMCRQWMQALMSMTSLMTISGSTLSTQMESAISPGIHTSFPHQRKCCRPSRTRSARYKKSETTLLTDVPFFFFLFMYSTSSPTIKGHVEVAVD